MGMQREHAIQMAIKNYHHKTDSVEVDIVLTWVHAFSCANLTLYLPHV